MTSLPEGGLKRVYINRHKIKQGVPAISVREGNGTLHAGLVAVRILGQSDIGHCEYFNKRPLACGARLWIETRAGMELIGPE